MAMNLYISKQEADAIKNGFSDSVKHIFYTKPKFTVNDLVTSNSLKLKVKSIRKVRFCDIDEKEFVKSGHCSKRHFMTWYRATSYDVQANPDLWIVDSEVAQ